ncbi:hypothetical protein ALC57_15646 [Trachymyrmex cornetzi]|uniref:Helix-turn-helix domain-containing protein n=1 Tax=Trachymyrmex cornetzi TaxID=471704 RepID=A0A151IWJ6_9HYME|nr:hypothetical protein ALC57_15646 [Trachymyrmex cornetzi]
MIRRDDWFINLWSVNFSIEVQCLLQLGEGFCLPPHNLERITIEFIKYIENNITKSKINNKSSLRNKKKGVIISLVDRAILLSDSEFHNKNLTLIINILRDNDYPLKFIFDVINKRLKNIRVRGAAYNNQDQNSVDQVTNVSLFTVPFIPLATKKFNQFNRKDIKVSFYSMNKLQKYLKVHKDPRLRLSKNNVEYRINCNDCDASYVEQTSRQLRTRIAEHRNHIRWNTSSRSVITEHRLENNHDFNWDEIEVLDEEPCYHKRLISEMLHIKKQKNSINLQTDTEGLHKAYIPIVNKFNFV